MTSRRTWSSLPACCSAESASLGDPMATLFSYGGQSHPRSAEARWPDFIRFVAFKTTQCHDARKLQSGTLPIAEMSSTVRCTVMANRLSQACSYRSV